MRPVCYGIRNFMNEVAMLRMSVKYASGPLSTVAPMGSRIPIRAVEHNERLVADRPHIRSNLCGQIL